MAKLRVKNLKKVQTQIRKKFTKALRQKDIQKEVGKIIVDDIQDNSVGKASAATKAWRRYYEPANKPLDPKYDIDEINFTFTGKLMNDLRNNVVTDFKSGQISYVIEHSNKKYPSYKKPKRKTRRKKGSKKPKASKRFTFKSLYEQIRSLDFSYDYLIFSNEVKADILKFIRKKLSKIK